MSRTTLKLAILAVVLIATVVCASPFAQPTQRGFQVQSTDQPAVPNGKYYALVIGINAYPAPMPTLKTAENDAQAIANTLHANYGFDVKLLLGSAATRNSILAAINGYEDALQPNDNLLIYYAGHGYENKTTGKAYWLPADAESTFSPNRIIADDITSEMATIPARHILVISDSCYSGGLTREAPTAPRAGIQNDAFLKRMLSSRSRTLMASGGDEPVSDAGLNDHSVFAYALLQALKAEDQSMFSASDLFYTSVRQRVAGSSAQLPQYAIIRNSTHDDGDFVFMRSGASTQILMDRDTFTATPRTLPSEPIAAAPDVPGNLSNFEVDFSRAEALFKGKNYLAAFPMMQTACEQGNAHGCASLGFMYRNGKGVAEDNVQSAIFYRKACDEGDAPSCTNLGAMYQDGVGVTKDNAQAIALYRKACTVGDDGACKHLKNIKP